MTTDLERRIERLERMGNGGSRVQVRMVFEGDPEPEEPDEDDEPQPSAASAKPSAVTQPLAAGAKLPPAGCRHREQPD